MKKLMIFTLLTIFSFSLNASFPVHKNKVEKEELTKITENAESTVIQMESTQTDLNANFNLSADEAISPAVSSGGETFIITILLWFFLGGLAAHRWYAKKPAGWNILFILTLGGLGVWWLIDGIMILTDSF